jgi:hypothetical protein
MSIGGVSIILILGMLNLVLLAFQLVTGMHWVRVPLGVHRTTGITLVVSAVLHASLAILAEAL